MESKTSPPKRRWFQLHLSTCIVMMLAASVLVYVNLQPNGSQRCTVYLSKSDGSPNRHMPLIIQPELGRAAISYIGHGSMENRLYMGWPYSFFCSMRSSAVKDGELQPSSASQFEFEAPDGGTLPALSLDIACALAILVISALAAELLARRLAERKLRSSESS